MWVVISWNKSLFFFFNWRWIRHLSGKQDFPWSGQREGSCKAMAMWDFTPHTETWKLLDLFLSLSLSFNFISDVFWHTDLFFACCFAGLERLFHSKRIGMWGRQFLVLLGEESTLWKLAAQPVASVGEAAGGSQFEVSVLLAFDFGHSPTRVVCFSPPPCRGAHGIHLLSGSVVAANCTLALALLDLC
jgi:hypothetical protein